MNNKKLSNQEYTFQDFFNNNKDNIPLEDLLILEDLLKSNLGSSSTYAIAFGIIFARNFSKMLSEYNKIN